MSEQNWASARNAHVERWFPCINHREQFYHHFSHCFTRIYLLHIFNLVYLILLQLYTNRLWSDELYIIKLNCTSWFIKNASFLHLYLYSFHPLHYASQSTTVSWLCRFTKHKYCIHQMRTFQKPHEKSSKSEEKNQMWTF